MYMYGQKDKNPKVNMDKQKQNGVGSENTEDTPKLPIKGRTRGSVSNKNSQPNSRDNSRDRSDSKEWKYDKCEGIFQSETSWILECEQCNTHRCTKCLNITISCYNSLNGRHDFPWFCEKCLAKTLNCIKEAKSIEERCSEFLQQFEEKVNDKINTVELECKQEIHKLRDEFMLVNNSENKVATGGNGAKTVSMAAKEVQSRVDRKNNIMLYNMPESTGNLKDDVLTHDLDIISELCDNIGISIKQEVVVNMRRLGKRVHKAGF